MAFECTADMRTKNTRTMNTHKNTMKSIIYFFFSYGVDELFQLKKERFFDL